MDKAELHKQDDYEEHLEPCVEVKNLFLRRALSEVVRRRWDATLRNINKSIWLLSFEHLGLLILYLFLKNSGAVS